MTQEKTATPPSTALQTRAALDPPPPARPRRLHQSEIETVLDTTDAMKEVHGPRCPTCARPARQDDHHPLLRSEHAHTRFLRASGQGAGRRRHQYLRRRLQRREGRVADRHGPHAAGGGRRPAGHAPLAPPGAPYLVARHLRAGVINAGDGAHAHPTQALLDLYTMRTHLGDLRGRRVVIVGDIEHSRVARSNIWALAAMGAEVVVCAPPTLLPAGMSRSDRSDRRAAGDAAGAGRNEP